MSGEEKYMKQYDINTRFKFMSPEKKLKLSETLYWSARNLNTISLKTMHPELSEEEIEKKVKEFFMYAKS